MIRAFQISDLDQVMQLWLDANLQAHDFIPKEHWEHHLDQVREMMPKAELYVYENDHTAVIEGFIGLSGSYVAGIFVRKNARSKGIGGQLIGHAKSIRRNLALKVYEKNQRALHFYLREGFIIQSQSIDAPTGQPAFFMVWERAEI